MNELTEPEKQILRDVVIRNAQAQVALQQAQAEAQRRASAFEAALDTILKLKGLNPERYQLAYNIEKDRYQIGEIPQEPKPEPKSINDRPPDLLMGPDGKPIGVKPVELVTGDVVTVEETGYQGKVEELPEPVTNPEMPDVLPGPELLVEPGPPPLGGEGPEPCVDCPDPAADPA